MLHIAIALAYVVPETKESAPPTVSWNRGAGTRMWKVAMLDKMTLKSPTPNRDPRVDLGGWLKSLREDRGMSQRQLATHLSLDYYTFISQLENGRGKIPPSRYLDWANALKQEPRSFVKKLMSHYDPATYDILFDDRDAEAK